MNQRSYTPESIPTKKPSRWGGECYESKCPFIDSECPYCCADAFELTTKEYNSKAVCVLDGTILPEEE